MWYLNYHDQNLIQYLNVTIHRLNYTLPRSCRQKLLNIHCRHPSCTEDGQNIVVNFTREQCDRYLKWLVCNTYYYTCVSNHLKDKTLGLKR